MDKISVVVPVYNVEPYLQRAVDSLLCQTYENLQIILVNDGSPDRCGEMCDAYAQKDSRVQVIHKENGGLSSARNAGIDLADGAYIAFLDSDDYFQPTMLERLYTVAEKENCDIVQCEFYRFCDDPSHDPEPGEVQIITPDQALTCIDEPVYMAAWNKLYKRELFEKIRFPHGKIHEDVGTTYRLFYEAGRIAVMKDAMYGYYENPDSITTSKVKMNKLDLVDMYAEQVIFFKEKGLENNRKRSANNLAAAFGTVQSYDPSRYQDYGEFMNGLQKKYRETRPLLLKSPLRWDLKLAVALSCGKVKFMGRYHKLKQMM